MQLLCMGRRLRLKGRVLPAETVLKHWRTVVQHTELYSENQSAAPCVNCSQVTKCMGTTR